MQKLSESSEAGYMMKKGGLLVMEHRTEKIQAGLKCSSAGSPRMLE